MDRAFTLAATPAAVWPWLVQLGKKRAGWYLPAAAERFLPPGRRAARDIRPAWQRLAAGDVIPDYGGRDETFEVAAIEPESGAAPVAGPDGGRVHRRADHRRDGGRPEGASGGPRRAGGGSGLRASA